MSRIAILEAVMAGLLLGVLGAVVPAATLVFYFSDTWYEAARSWPTGVAASVACAAIIWFVARNVLEGEDALPSKTAAVLGAVCTVTACWVGWWAVHFSDEPSPRFQLDVRSPSMWGRSGIFVSMLFGSFVGTAIGWLGRMATRRHRNWEALRVPREKTSGV